MNTGCPDCDRVQKQTGSAVQLCLKHTVEYLECSAVKAQKDYEQAKEQYERKQNELSSSRPS